MRTCTLFLAAAISLCTCKSIAQVDSVIVSNLTVMLAPVIDSGASFNQSPTQKMLTAFFKVNDPASIAKVYVKVGQDANSTELAFDSLTIVNHSGTYCMHLGANEMCKFNNKNTAYRKSVSMSQFANMRWLTVYARDTNGNLSAKKYFKIH